MNFLAHLHLSDIAGLPLSGAILGDVVRGRLEGLFPATLERSIRLHRRIDVVTDSHPAIATARARFPEGNRRYAGMLLDLLYDHCLALDWPRAEETLDRFAERAAAEMSNEAAWQLATGKPAPEPLRFARLLRSYGSEAGIDKAIDYVASRLSEPARLHSAAQDWRARIPELRTEFPVLLSDLESMSRTFGAASITPG
jgi:acyl carrier protein phosphodiesterase